VLLDPCIREVLITLSHAGFKDHDHVLVPTGYARFIRDLPERFMGLADMATVLPDPGAVGSNVDIAELLGHFMPVSLSLRGIDRADSVNFRKKDLAFTKKIEWIKGYTGTWPKVAAAFVVLWIVGMSLNIGMGARVNHQLTQKIAREFSSIMPPGTPMVDPVKQMEQQLGRLAPKSGQGASGATPLDILRDISVGIPKSIDVLVDSISIDEESITVTGTASTYDNVEKVKAGLASLPYAGEVKIVSANVDKTDQRIRLKLVCSKK
jgi:hypothetical protein